ncbi:hypothetical protein J2Y46_002357 [Microbacterium sp. BE35]|uniref:SHOCT domain-containing protein n=1 Tax=Microbacterium sp. BE35 TaxID=2817773 RepID=UPI0028668C19|nr:SHOCT domain-containing protein [Microbacterium sp. BE35]MDR7189531.1 hypothetical protein [Microbacterium sp. BE35]
MHGDVLATKMANALIEDVQISLAPGVDELISAFGSDLVMPAVRPVISVFRAAWGGLWVGGRVTLTPEAVSFAPNAMNRAVQSGSLDVEVPLALVTGVDVIPAFMTNIVAISTPELVLKVRCYGAREFADAARAARDQAVETLRNTIADARAAQAVDEPEIQSLPDSLVTSLRELSELHSAGALTDEEFRDAKRAVLRNSAAEE